MRAMRRRRDQPAAGHRRLEPEPLDEAGSFAPCFGTPPIPEKMAGCSMPAPGVRGFSGPTNLGKTRGYAGTFSREEPNF